MTVLSTALDLVPGSDWILDVTRYTGQQVLTLTGGATSGTFLLTYHGGTSAPIAYNANGAAMQTALEAASTIGSGNVSVSGSGGGPWTVTPQGILSPDDFRSHPMTINTAGLSGGSNYRLTVDLPKLDVHTGYTYEFQARDVAAETTPDVQIDATHITQGSIDVTTSGASGLIIVTINKTATAALSPGTNTGGILNFVLMETVSSVRSPLVEGQIRVKQKWFV